MNRFSFTLFAATTFMVTAVSVAAHNYSSSDSSEWYSGMKQRSMMHSYGNDEYDSFQEHFKHMQSLMDSIHNTEDLQHQQQLMDEHMGSLRQGVHMMNDMWPDHLPKPVEQQGSKTESERLDIIEQQLVVMRHLLEQLIDHNQQAQTQGENQ